MIGILVPVTALLQQWFTTRRMFMSAMALFLAGTCLCAVSLPGCILNATMMPVTGKFFDKLGPRFVIMPGLVMITISLWLFAGIDSDTTRGSVLFNHVLLFLGISFVIMPAQTAGMNQLPLHLLPHGTAIYNTLQQIAGGICIALFVSIMSSGANRYIRYSLDPAAFQDKAQSIVAGLQTVFWIEFFLVVPAIVLSWFIKELPELHELVD
ncbi:MFS transporter [Paenibacillus anseongensis]|uniref:MFS transporter n=1 Tax=Paenibacillus TaxID=44249 RepID=UPI001FE52E17|nr:MULTISPECIES: MFS transporter [Paenibacillus]